MYKVTVTYHERGAMSYSSTSLDEVKRVANKFVVGLSILNPTITFYKDEIVL